MDDKNFASYEGKFSMQKEKDKNIKKEIAKLRKVFKDLDKNKMTTVHSLIQTAAFMAVTLAELEKTINLDGCVCEYKNGENQYGTKKSPEVEIHIAMTKNYATIMKQLTDLIPPEKRKDSRLAALRDE